MHRTRSITVKIDSSGIAKTVLLDRIKEITDGKLKDVEHSIFLHLVTNQANQKPLAQRTA